MKVVKRVWKRKLPDGTFVEECVEKQGVNIGEINELVYRWVVWRAF